jgi:hypothetical protein
VADWSPNDGGSVGAFVADRSPTLAVAYVSGAALSVLADGGLGGERRLTAAREFVEARERRGDGGGGVRGLVRFRSVLSDGTRKSMCIRIEVVPEVERTGVMDGKA